MRLLTIGFNTLRIPEDNANRHYTHSGGPYGEFYSHIIVARNARMMFAKYRQIRIIITLTIYIFHDSDMVNVLKAVLSLVIVHSSSIQHIEH